MRSEANSPANRDAIVGCTAAGAIVGGVGGTLSERGGGGGGVRARAARGRGGGRWDRVDASENAQRAKNDKMRDDTRRRRDRRRPRRRARGRSRPPARGARPWAPAFEPRSARVEGPRTPGRRAAPTSAARTQPPKKTKIAPRRSDYSTRARESAARLKGLTGLPRRALGSPSRASVPAETRCPRARAPCAMAREIARVPGSQSTASRADVAREQREKSRFKRLAKGSRPR